MTKMVITIDGPAGSGKSTVAKLLAKRLGAGFLDTGAMYRAVTLAAMQAGIDMNDEEKLQSVLDNSKFQFKPEKDIMTVSINGVDVTKQLRQPQVTANTRHVASSVKLREKLVHLQRQFAANEEKIVTEGRDQGTVAFRDADIKIFLTADNSERAKRRRAELLQKGLDTTLEQVESDIEKRDNNDKNRKVGPLKPAQDAVIIDTTDLSIEQVVDKILHHVGRND